MASNTVEQIFVELLLNATGYNKQADDAVKKIDNLAKGLGKTEKQSVKTSKTFDGLVSGVGKAAKGVAGFAAIVAAGTGLLKLADEARKANDELNFLSKNLGMSSQEVKAWGGAAAAMGGSAQGMAGDMKSLNGSMNDFVMTGESSMLPMFNTLGVSMIDAQGKVRGTNDVMLDLADSMSKMDREQAVLMGQKMGFDEGTVNTLLQGRDAMQEMVNYHKQMYSSNKEEMAASRKLSENQAKMSAHWDSMKLLMGNAIIPLLVKLSDIALKFFEFLQRHQKTVKTVFEGMAIFLGMLVIPLLGKALIAALAFIAPFAPFILVVGLLGAAFVALYQDYKTWAEGGDSLFNWGAFRDYIDGATLSTDNLKNAFKNLTKDMLENTIPTLKGYADIVKALASGDFKLAGSLATDMLGNLGRNIGDRIDDLTGNEQGSFIESASNIISSGIDKATGKKGWKLGQTSSKFETGGRGAGTVSSGKGDHGGVSYGSYQMSSKMGTVQDFLKSSGYAAKFKGQQVNSDGFKKTWKQLAKSDPNFAKAQHDYIKKTHFDVQQSNLKKGGIDLSRRGAGVQDMLWSTSVQFGAHNKVVNKALSGKDISKMSDAQIISAVQDYKKRNTKSLFSSSPSQWGGLSKRASDEKTALLSLNAEKAQQSMPKANVPTSIAKPTAGGKTSNVEVTVKELNVNTSSSTMSGTGGDAAMAIKNKFYQFPMGPQ